MPSLAILMAPDLGSNAAIFQPGAMPIRLERDSLDLTEYSALRPLYDINSLADLPAPINPV